MDLLFSISNSVTQEEWEKAYEESLYLADKLGLADWERFYYKGVRHYAYCKVKEQAKMEFGEEEHFLRACSEYNHICGRNYIRLDRKLNKHKYKKNAGPAILEEIDSYTNVNSKRFENQTSHYHYEIWGGYYYIRVLAILCLLEGRLKEKVFIYGEVGKEDFEAAVSIANKYLKDPIEVSARCDYKRLYEIVKTIDIPDEEKLNLMENAYLGEIDLNYKSFIEARFDKTAINKFWKKRFKDCDVQDDGFKETLKAYLSYGFDFKDLFTYISFAKTREKCLKLLELVIRIENNKDKFSKALGLTRDPKDNGVRGFSLEFRRSLFGPKCTIDATYSFDDYVTELSKHFGEQIDVRDFLKEKIKDEDEEGFILRLKDFADNEEDDYYYSKDERKYDIFHSPLLIHYKTGYTITPFLLGEIKEVVKKSKELLAGKEFKEIEKKETLEQIYDLIDMNPNFPVRDIDWRHAIDFFYAHSDAVKRYYPLFRMKLKCFSLEESIAKALFLNDEFFEFCKGL